mgnify:CR=1 FL=1
MSRMEHISSLPTKRLLAYYKARRKEYCRDEALADGYIDLKSMKAHLDAVKAELNKRENV